MTCNLCADLLERIAWLESELGLSADAGEAEALRRVIQSAISRRPSGWQAGGSLGPARALLALYRAHGRVLSRAQLMDAVPPSSGGDDERKPGIVSVWVSSIRAALGFDAIESIWGTGYRLSPLGIEHVRAALGEVTEREARLAHSGAA